VCNQFVQSVRPPGKHLVGNRRRVVFVFACCAEPEPELEPETVKKPEPEPEPEPLWSLSGSASLLQTVPYPRLSKSCWCSVGLMAISRLQSLLFKSVTNRQQHGPSLAACEVQAARYTASWYRKSVPLFTSETFSSATYNFSAARGRREFEEKTFPWQSPHNTVVCNPLSYSYQV